MPLVSMRCLSQGHTNESTLNSLPLTAISLFFAAVFLLREAPFSLDEHVFFQKTIAHHLRFLGGRLHLATATIFVSRPTKNTLLISRGLNSQEHTMDPKKPKPTTSNTPSFELRMSILSAVDYAPGESIRDRVKAVSKRVFTDTHSGFHYSFTWRTISTWPPLS